MWEMLGHLPNFGQNTSMASHPSVIPEIHVLLVDHDSHFSLSTAKMLELCSYKVSYVEFASGALSILSNGNTQFDVVMADINSPDLYGYTLLQLAVNMDIPILMMTNDENELQAIRALESGAFLFIKKQDVTIDMLKSLWQHVVREKAKIYTRKHIANRLAAVNNHLMEGAEFGGEFNGQNINIGGYNNMSNTDPKGKKRMQGRKRSIGADEDSELSQNDDENANSRVKRRVYTEWTQELHAKFMDAVKQLGDGRCFPKEILELMNEPGLTRMQVASHLQKCRNDNWRIPEMRNSKNNNAADSEGSSINKARKFGSMPKVIKCNAMPNNYPADDLFSFPDMNFLTHNFPAMEQACGSGTQESPWNSSTVASVEASFEGDSSETSGK